MHPAHDRERPAPTPDQPHARFVPVVPAGGAGTRLWPLSRARSPKFLLDLTGGGRSMLQQTVDRLDEFADVRPLVVTGAAHAQAVGEQLGERVEVLAEPTPRNSMPAIALAAAVAESQDPRAVIGSFAADHMIEDTAAFGEAVRHARLAAEAGYLATIGITPDRPATGFGYIEHASTGTTSPELSRSGALAVEAFVEKPDRERAERFLADGRHLWNAGMFVARASMLLDALADHIPALADGARRIAHARGTADEDEVMETVWPTLTAIAIDHALAEPLSLEGRVAVVPGHFAWDDVGDYAALARQLRDLPTSAGAGAGVDEASDLAVRGRARVLAVDSRATVHSSSQRPIAVVGLEGISVVEREDVLLVVSDDHSQDLSELVRSLETHGWGELS